MQADPTPSSPALDGFSRRQPWVTCAVCPALHRLGPEYVVSVTPPVRCRHPPRPARPSSGPHPPLPLWPAIDTGSFRITVAASLARSCASSSFARRILRPRSTYLDRRIRVCGSSQSVTLSLTMSLAERPAPRRVRAPPRALTVSPPRVPSSTAWASAGLLLACRKLLQPKYFRIPRRSGTRSAGARNSRDGAPLHPRSALRSCPEPGKDDLTAEGLRSRVLN